MVYQHCSWILERSGLNTSFLVVDLLLFYLMFCTLGYFCFCVWTLEQHGIDLMWLNRTTLGSREPLWLYIQFRWWLLINKYQYTQLSLACHGRYVFKYLILKCTSRLFQSLMEPWHRKIGAIGMSVLFIGSYLFVIRS